jgi:hypothetical protein
MGHRLRPGRITAVLRVLPLAAVLLLHGAKLATAGSSLGAHSNGPSTSRLDFTNIALVTLEACLFVAWAIAQEVVFRQGLCRVAVTASRLVLLVAVAFVPRPAGATVEMQNQAKKLGVDVGNCLYCHASPHSIEVMKKKAKDLHMAGGNCLACHGANIPIKLNQRGEWLVAEKARRIAKEFDMAWLKDYREPLPLPKPAAPKESTAKPGAKPDTIQLGSKPEQVRNAHP